MLYKWTLLPAWPAPSAAYLNYPCYVFEASARSGAGYSSIVRTR